ncbi:A24 family peptidase [Vibrio breoganii]|uniref:A24 family peptidase n=1 Tax=Vibrio breoganii TaxID=553239 RepID=UPI00037A6E5D|nr:prepilin peptidase [Vibrio breoganii]OED97874.1 hypothetical protein A1QG_09940 [Vibrio breoganii ZF-29]PMG96664.1 hypothetical protein BCU79_06070 [Vibrio breoganii]PMK61197.1 hypothetical protein BCT97_04340 [Vibrio breoganii]PMO29057.1 hypothetical protein BCT14_07150 [Vibrio breoganii]PMO33605.1 hypothetical protein BCT13_01245 [Vibrio breoganii]
MFECVFLGIAVSICVYDIKYRLIKNEILFFLLLTSMLITSNDIDKIVLSVFISSLIAFALYIAHIWGGGDSKLLIALSPLFLPQQIPDFIVATLLCGGMLSFFYWTKYRVVSKNIPDKGLPYGVAIVSGANLSLYFSQGLPIYS